MSSFTQLYDHSILVSPPARSPLKSFSKFFDTAETEASYTLYSQYQNNTPHSSKAKKVVPDFSSPSKTTRHSIFSGEDIETDRKSLLGIEADFEFYLESASEKELFYESFDQPEIASLKIKTLNQKLAEGKKTIGGKQYLATLNILDAFRKQKIMVLKEKLTETSEGLFWDFSNFSDHSFMFSPSAVLVPSLNFILKLELEEVNSQRLSKMIFPSFSICLSSEQQENFRIQGIFEDLMLEIDCQSIRSKEQKEREIENLNYKVDHKLYCEAPLIKINRIKVNSTSNIEVKPEIIEEKKENQLVETLKTQIGSKNFQKELQSAHPQFLMEVVYKISGHFSELIKNQYANYSIQELFPLLPINLRLQILQELQLNLKESICSVHGTFVFQSFMDYFTGVQEYEAIIRSIRDNFSELSLDSYGSHSIRKLIEKIPEYLLLLFTEKVEEDFLRLSQNRHGVCVVKNIFRRIRKSTYEETQQFKKRILFIFRQNLSEIIPGEYSNYLVQEICESFPADDCEALHQQIVNNFYGFPLNKYSAITLTKCVQQYWRNKPYYCKEVISRLNRQTQEKMGATKQGKKLLQQLHNSHSDSRLELVDNKKSNKNYNNRNYRNKDQKNKSRKYINS